ncbi:MAG: hypothetical protein HOJ06_15415, partial [Rhodospirillaceae bacterium]|nr:hypothetical protein [Rhodospirillaceae bacterium]
AALKLGVDGAFKTTPPAYDFWLEKRATSVKGMTPSTYFPGADTAVDSRR